jgi:hypothetical protein
MMGMPSQVLLLCKNLNFRIKDTSDLELNVERLGLNITSLKPSFDIRFYMHDNLFFNDAILPNK